MDFYNIVNSKKDFNPKSGSIKLDMILSFVLRWLKFQSQKWFD